MWNMWLVKQVNKDHQWLEFKLDLCLSKQMSILWTKVEFVSEPHHCCYVLVIYPGEQEVKGDNADPNLMSGFSFIILRWS